jgi:hypothetical protein
VFVSSHPIGTSSQGVFKRQHGPQGLAEADLGFRAFGLCPRVPSKPKLFGTFKAREVLQTPAKVAGVSVWCTHHACARDNKLDTGVC